MTDELPSHLRRLLAAERARPDAPPDAMNLARGRLAGILGPTAGLGNAVRAASAPAATAGAGLAKLAGAFLLGSAATAGALHLTRTPEPTSTREAARSSTVAPSGPTAADPSAAPWMTLPVADVPPPGLPTSTTPPPTPPTIHAAPSPPAAAPSASASTHPDRELAGERLLLERARSALARGDAPQALAALDQHEREHPRGQLAEEREALAVQALVTAGRTSLAITRADTFRKTYPRSVLLPVVDEALR